MKTPPRLLVSAWPLLVLSAAPFLCLVFLTTAFPMEVPFWDEWHMVPVMEKAFEGTLKIGDLWGQSNEHRIFFPRILLVLFALVTNWDIRWEVAANVICMFLFFLIVAGALIRRDVEEKTDRPLWLLPVFSVFIFSLRQCENWTWGVQLQMFLCVLAAAAGLAVLAKPGLTARSFFAAAICGYISAYSFASGFAFWPAGLFLLWTKETRVKTRIASSLLWILLAAVCLAVYLHGYVRPHWHPEPVFPLDRPKAFLEHFSACLGSLFVVHRTFHALETAIGLGIAGAVVFLVLCALGAFRPPRPNLRFFFAMALFGFLTAAMTAYGRAGFSPYQALASRYVTTSLTFWVGLAGMSGWLAVRLRTGGKIQKTTAGVLCAAWLLLMIPAAYASWKSSFSLIERTLKVREASQALGDLTDDVKLSTLYSDPAKLRRWAPVLKEKKLTIYRERRG